MTDEETEEFIEEPQEVVEEMKIRQGKDLCKQDVLRGSTTIQDAENLAIKLLATITFEEENGDWEFIEHGLMEETEEFIEEPQEVVEEMKIRQGKDLCKQDVLRGSTTIQDAENLAIKLLATRGLINDGVCRSIFTAVQQGNNGTDADKAVKLVFQDAESDGEQESKLMSKHSMDQILFRPRSNGSEVRMHRKKHVKQGYSASVPWFQLGNY
ncbi:uncharacterized protein LOC116122317 [Pistacia vera]|uniref:uncharacterized protein LOC116122317 n=1 Tax=Pistacia vera TaxID=55513 RepID=UPI001262DDCB|nr:uncharacterized protein LOC116122317 [Pistacia vera]